MNSLVFVLILSQVVAIVFGDCKYSNCTSCIADNGCSWCLIPGGAWTCQDLSLSCTTAISPNSTCPECESYYQCSECASDSSCTWCQDADPNSCKSINEQCDNHLTDACRDYCSAFAEVSLCESSGCTWCHLAQQCGPEELFCIHDSSSSSDGDYLPLWAYLFFALGASLVIVGVILGVLYIKRRIEVGPAHKSQEGVEREPLVISASINDDEVHEEVFQDT